MAYSWPLIAAGSGANSRPATSGQPSTSGTEAFDGRDLLKLSEQEIWDISANQLGEEMFSGWVVAHGRSMLRDVPGERRVRRFACKPKFPHALFRTE